MDAGKHPMYPPVYRSIQAAISACVVALATLQKGLSETKSCMQVDAHSFVEGGRELKGM